MIKGFVSRILARFRHGKWPEKSVKYKNNCLKEWRVVSITQQMQKKVRMENIEQDLKRIALWVFESCWAEQFSKLISFACNFKLLRRETHLVVTKQWFSHLDP